MAPGFRSSPAYELLRKESSESLRDFNGEVFEDAHYRPPTLHNLCSWIRCRTSFRSLRSMRADRRHLYGYRGLLCWATVILVLFFLLTIIFTAAFFPSYTTRPGHYNVLQKRCQESSRIGRGNVNNEKIFIAASLFDPDGQLAGGYWGRSIVALVDLLGHENVHLSVYENDAGPLAKTALEDLKAALKCNTSLVSEHLPMKDIPQTLIPSGERLASRIAFLAEVRNRALRPIRSSSVRFDRLLFVNDVMFNPVDAVQLLFSTNSDQSGRANYGAACAVDFINPFKFYDRFATRDLEGHYTGAAIFPWFTDAGNASSRRDVLAQKDAVRVRSCWGGMTAFEAKWFQGRFLSNDSLPVASRDDDMGFDIAPLHFRFEDELFWEASECCLIHADLAHIRQQYEPGEDLGIFMNPYIRVSYDVGTLRWLPYTRRLERLFSPIQNFINFCLNSPGSNQRRLEEPNDRVIETVWTYDEAPGNESMTADPRQSLSGSLHEMNRVAAPGGFCGSPVQLVMKEDPQSGEQRWLALYPPP